MFKGLNDRQSAFVREFLIDLNATQAAIRAGYSQKTAGAMGHELLKKPEIKAAIDKAKEKRSEKTKIDAAWLLERLAEEATADIADIYDDDGNLLPVKQWPKIWRMGLVQGIEVEELFDGRGEGREHIGRVRKVRIDNRVKRLELIGKHIGVQAFEEKIKASVDGNVTITVNTGVPRAPDE